MAGTTGTLELKRLGFVKSYAAWALGMGESTYKAARGFVPAFADPYIAQAEDAAVSYAAPLVASANDKAAELLSAVDAKLDGALGAVDGTLQYSRDLHAKNMSSFASAKEGAFGFVEGYVNATKAALDPQRYVDYAAGIGKSVVDTIAAYADPDKLVAAASTLYQRFSSQGPLLKVLELADPVITASQSQYGKMHGMLVGQPLYKKLYETVSSVPAKVADTALYRKGYPLVAPVADPVISNFTKSKVIKQLDAHLKPKVA